MPSREDLTKALRGELLARLSPRGWSLVEPSHSDAVVELTRPLDSGLDATVSALGPSGSWGELVSVHGIDVGVGYCPLRELTPLTGAYGLDVVRSPLFADGTLALDLSGEFHDEHYDHEDDLEDDLEDEEYEGPGAHPNFAFRARTLDEAGTVGQQLARVVIEHGCRVADRYAGVDELIDTTPRLQSAALLAATGRLEAAATVLDGLSIGSGSLWMDERRCAYQLRRWISSGGDRALLPTGPPPPGGRDATRGERERRSFSEIRSSTREKRAAQDAAYQSARERASGLDRDQQRAILAQELDARGIEHSPIDLELHLDHLWDTKADQWATLGKGVVSLGRFGVKAIRAMRGNEQIKQEFEDRFDRMDGFEPPDPAFFEVTTDGGHTGVELAGVSEQALEQVYERAWPKVMGIATIQEGWLKPADGGSITVHAAEWEIGTIPAGAAEAFEETMRDAGFRGEFPKLTVRIARLGKPPRYLVEVATPSPSAPPA